MTRSIPKTISAAALAIVGLCLASAPASAEDCQGFMALKVTLTIVGKPGDAFRIVGKCGKFEVTECTAVIAEGEKKAKCSNTGIIELPGRKTCPVEPKKGNSKKAAVQTSGCVLK